MLVLEGMEERISAAEEVLSEQRARRASAEEERLEESKARVRARPAPASRQEQQALLTSEFVRESFRVGWPFVAAADAEGQAQPRVLSAGVDSSISGRLGSSISGRGSAQEAERSGSLGARGGGGDGAGGSLMVGAGDGGRGGRRDGGMVRRREDLMVAQMEAQEVLREFKRESTLYRSAQPLQTLWEKLFPDSIDWELGWSMHLKVLGRISQEASPTGSEVPRVFSSLPARKVDYVLGLAREALEANEVDRARQLVAEAKLELSGAPADDECKSEVQRLADEIEVAAIDADFPY